MMSNVSQGVGKGTFSYIAGDGIIGTFLESILTKNLENAHSRLLLLNIKLKMK